MLIRSTVGVTTTELEQAASQLEKYMSQRFVHAVVRQQDCQRDDAAFVRRWHCHRDDAGLIKQRNCHCNDAVVIRQQDCQHYDVALVRQQDCQRDDAAFVRQRNCHRDDAGLIKQRNCHCNDAVVIRQQDCQHYDAALVRQQDCQPDEVAVLLTTKSKMERALKNLCDEGYESGPPVGPELTLTEGQPIIMRFRGNIADADGRTVKLTDSRCIMPSSTILGGGHHVFGLFVRPSVVH